MPADTAVLIRVHVATCSNKHQHLSRKALPGWHQMYRGGAAVGRVRAWVGVGVRTRTVSPTFGGSGGEGCASCTFGARHRWPLQDVPTLLRVIIASTRFQLALFLRALGNIPAPVTSRVARGGRLVAASCTVIIAPHFSRSKLSGQLDVERRHCARPPPARKMRAVCVAQQTVVILAALARGAALLGLDAHRPHHDHVPLPSFTAAIQFVQSSRTLGSSSYLLTSAYHHLDRHGEKHSAGTMKEWPCAHCRLSEGCSLCTRDLLPCAAALPAKRTRPARASSVPSGFIVQK